MIEVVETYNYLEKISEIRQRFRVKSNRSGKKQNGEDVDMFEDPNPTSSAEAFNYLKNYYAAMYCELAKDSFIKKYKCWDIELIKAELKEMDKFLNKAQAVSISEAYEAYGKHNDKDEFVYQRLLFGFYRKLELELYPPN